MTNSSRRSLTHLPEDTEALKALVRQPAGGLKTQALTIVQLKAQIARLRRMQFGQSSEKRAKAIEQLELQLEEQQEYEAAVSVLGPVGLRKVIKKPYRKPLLEPLPRAEEVHEPPPAPVRIVVARCASCGKR